MRGKVHSVKRREENYSDHKAESNNIFLALERRCVVWREAVAIRVLKGEGQGMPSKNFFPYF